MVKGKYPPLSFFIKFASICLSQPCLWSVVLFTFMLRFFLLVWLLNVRHCEYVNYTKYLGFDNFKFIIFCFHGD